MAGKNRAGRQKIVGGHFIRAKTPCRLFRVWAKSDGPIDTTMPAPVRSSHEKYSQRTVWPGMKHTGIREQWTIRIIVAITVVFVCLSILFAWLQNPGIERNENKARGILVFINQGCVQCHSLSGTGSGRLSLDGIGNRLGENEIRDWIVANPPVINNLSPTIRTIKSSYANIPQQDMNALLYLLNNSK